MTTLTNHQRHYVTACDSPGVERARRWSMVISCSLSSLQNVGDGVWRSRVDPLRVAEFRSAGAVRRNAETRSCRVAEAELFARAREAAIVGSADVVSHAWRAIGPARDANARRVDDRRGELCREIGANETCGAAVVGQTGITLVGDRRALARRAILTIEAVREVAFAVAARELGDAAESDVGTAGITGIADAPARPLFIEDARSGP